MAKRIVVEWMTNVPVDEEGSHDFDRADWHSKEFGGNDMKKARNFARKEASRNTFGQVWIRTEHAPTNDAYEWQWERDFSADEIVERA